MWQPNQTLPFEAQIEEYILQAPTQHIYFLRIQFIEEPEQNLWNECKWLIYINIILQTKQMCQVKDSNISTNDKCIHEFDFYVETRNVYNKIIQGFSNIEFHRIGFAIECHFSYLTLTIFRFLFIFNSTHNIELCVFLLSSIHATWLIDSPIFITKKIYLWYCIEDFIIFISFSLFCVWNIYWFQFFLVQSIE